MFSRPKSHQFIRDNFFSFAYFAISNLKPLFLVFFVNTSLGVEKYGILSVFLSSIAYMSLFTSLGIGTYMKRYLPPLAGSGDIALLFYKPIVFQLFLAVILSPAFAVVAVSTGVLNSTDVSGLLAFFIVFTVFHYFAEFYRYAGEIKRYTVLMTAYTIVYISSLAVLIKGGAIVSPAGVILADAIVMSLMLLTFAPSVLTRVPFPMDDIGSMFHIKMEFKSGFPYAIIDMAQNLLTSADKFVILFLLGSAQVGIYASLVTVGYLPVVFSRILNFATPQMIFKARDRNDDKRVDMLFKATVTIYLSLAPPMACVLYILRDSIFFFLHVDEKLFEKVLFVVLFTAVINGLYFLFSSINHMEMKMGRQMKMLITFAVLNIIMNTIFVWMYEHIIYAALTSLFAQLAIFAILVADVRTKWNLDRRYLACIFPLGFFGVALSIVTALHYAGLSLNPLAYCAMVIVVYAAICGVLAKRLLRVLGVPQIY